LPDNLQQEVLDFVEFLVAKSHSFIPKTDSTTQRIAGLQRGKAHIEEDFDEPLGISTGAAVIFGATGGVMEAALRTAYEVLTGKQLEKLDFIQLRGLEGIKEAAIDIEGVKLKVAVANSLSCARKLLEEVKIGKSPYAFIEIMTCPGGCLGGAGQPISTDPAVKLKRMEAIYREDKNKAIRKSHENPAVQALYQEFLGQPLGEKSHHLLHTHYVQRKGRL
jgi:iron only hydrogenase large subunit-like protein